MLNFISRIAMSSVMLGTLLLEAHSVQICKSSDSTSPVSGTFYFDLYSPAGSTIPITVSVSPGACSDVIVTNSGEVRIIERPVVAAEVVGISADIPERLVSFNLTTRTAVVLALEDPVPTRVTFTNRTITGNQGCTPGFYKNHTSAFTAPFTITRTVGSVFVGVLPSLASTTLLDALDGGGGPGIEGAQKILLRAATAAILNAANGGVSYPLTVAQIITQVSAALATGDRATIIALGDRLDSLNNGVGGCPLSGRAQ